MDEVTRAITAAVRHLSSRDRHNLLQLREIGGQGGRANDGELLGWFLPVAEIPGVPTRGAAYRFMGCWAHHALGGRARHWDDLALAMAERSGITNDEAALVLGDEADISLSRRCDAASARRGLWIVERSNGSTP